MSRIVGVISDREAPLGATVRAMADAVSLEGWTMAPAGDDGRAGAAWVGRRTPQRATRGTAWAVMDGYVYNRADFAPEESDAAVALALFERHGIDGALARINGDFALAIGDAAAGVTYLARDRFGFKPLYYARRGDRLAFASRPRGVMAAFDGDWPLNRQFVAVFAGSHYRYFDNQPARSPYDDIFQVPAAHFVRVDDGGERIARYWTLDADEDLAGCEEDLAAEYRDRLIDAVRIRLAAATRRPAFTLSGGMDSSSVLASAVRVTGAKQHAYSVVYDDKVYDESAEIATMLDSAVDEWHPIAIGTPDVATVVDRLVALHDEPVATSTWLSHHLVCEQARRDGVGALFGGLGGDELNAGEYEYFFYFFADLAVAGRNGDLARETAKWIEYHDHPIFKKSEAVMRAGLERLVDLGHPGHTRADRARLEKYQRALDPELFDLRSFEPAGEWPFTSYLKNRAFQDLFFETAPCCLRAEDRQCTAADLDHFLPFLDHRLVEFMFRVPGTMKFRHGVTKHLLRLATRGLLPEDTRTRIKKTGWNAPAHVWFAGAGADMLRDLVRSREFRERGIYRPDAVLAIIDEHDAIVSENRVAENHMMFLWQLLNLELWLRQVKQPVA
jgi:asparagine synthase (glutamine-hydrolysing)